MFENLANIPCHLEVMSGTEGSLRPFGLAASGRQKRGPSQPLRAIALRASAQCDRRKALRAIALRALAKGRHGGVILSEAKDLREPSALRPQGDAKEAIRAVAFS